MKRYLFIAALLAGGLWANTHYASASDAAGSKGETDTADNHAARPGKQIRQTSVKGYTLTYHLLDLAERGDMAKLMVHHPVIGMSKSPDATNHLMVYIRKPDGKAVTGDVAYAVKGPDGRDFRTMTMGMHGGYGVDVNLKRKGAYSVRTKIILDGKEAISFEDEFLIRVD